MRIFQTSGVTVRCGARHALSDVGITLQQGRPVDHRRVDDLALIGRAGPPQRRQPPVGQQPRDQWCAAAVGREVCVRAVLDPAEAGASPHSTARGSYVDVAGLRPPAPAPRLSRTPASVDAPPPPPGQLSRDALTDWGVAPDVVTGWERAGAVRPLAATPAASARTEVRSTT